MDLEQKAIERLRLASDMSLTYYQQPLIITTSGGKDSDVCLELARRSGIPYEVQHSLTTADAPQTVRHVLHRFKGLEAEGVKCTINHPTYQGQRVSMWSLIPQKLMPPTRIARYCCEVLKEQGGKNRMIVTGVRWAESQSRKHGRGIYEQLHRDKKKRIVLANDNDDTRDLFENCQLKAKRVCNPIIDWEDRDVWGYIRAENIKMNPLYDMGFLRVGCIGCPMADKKRYHEFRVFPKYEKLYLSAFGRMLEVRKSKEIPTEWESAEEVMAWWMNESIDQQRMY